MFWSIIIDFFNDYWRPIEKWDFNVDFTGVVGFVWGFLVIASHKEFIELYNPVPYLFCIKLLFHLVDILLVDDSYLIPTIPDLRCIILFLPFLNNIFLWSHYWSSILWVLLLDLLRVPDLKLLSKRLSLEELIEFLFLYFGFAF